PGTSIAGSDPPYSMASALTLAPSRFAMTVDAMRSSLCSACPKKRALQSRLQRDAVRSECAAKRELHQQLTRGTLERGVRPSELSLDRPWPDAIRCARHLLWVRP